MSRFSVARGCRVLVFALTIFAALRLVVRSDARVTGSAARTLNARLAPGTSLAQTFTTAHGPESVIVQFAAIWPAAVDVAWRLQVRDDQPPGNWTTASDRRSTVWIPPGRSARTFEFSPVAFPADGRYRFEFVPLEIRSIIRGTDPAVSLVARSGEFPTDDRADLGGTRLPDVQLILDVATAEGVFEGLDRRFADRLPRFLRGAGLHLALISLAIAIPLELTLGGWGPAALAFGFASFFTLYDNAAVLVIAVVAGAAACYRLARNRSPASVVSSTADRSVWGHALDHRWSSVASLALCLVGAVVFSAMFHQRLGMMPADAYRVRDDGVITLSHARNLVDYGFIGVSPSGERLEAFSAPLQFWTNVVVYGATRVDFKTFWRLQTELGTLLLGGLFTALLVFRHPVRSGTVAFALFVLAAVLTAARMLADSRTFLLWHASGMENVFTHVTTVALMLALALMLEQGRIRFGFVVFAFAASISRIDSVIAVAILLVAFVGLWRLLHRTWAGLKFAAASAVPWAVFILWRWWYFGQWQPNTAIAQSISVSSRLRQFANQPLASSFEYFQWTFDVGSCLQLFALALTPLLVLVYRPNRFALSRYVLILAGVLACTVEYVCFGSARMDEARTVTHFAILCAALAPWMLAARDEFSGRDLLVAVGIFAASIVIADRQPADRDHVGWGVRDFEANADRAEAIAREYDIPRPALAIPDLGAVSWRKQFNIVDIGRLGSAAIARLPDMRWYIAEFVKPDIIEVHGVFSCGAGPVQSSAQFIADYMPLGAGRTSWLDENCASDPAAESGFWVRRDIIKGAGSKERTFLEAFASRLDPELVRRELLACQHVPGIRPCGYVGRTLFRLVPELKERGQFDRIATLLAADPRLAVEHAFFTSSRDPLWWQRVVPLIHGWPQ